MLCSTLRQLVALTFDQYRVKSCATAIFLCFTLLPTLAAAQKVLGRAPDASKARDPFKRTSGYYIFDFAEDKDVLPGCMADGNYDCKIQIFAQVYRPNNLDSGPYPLIIFLHGNHMTCGKPNTTLPGNPRDDDNIQFTKDGTCPAAPYLKFPFDDGTGKKIETGVPSDEGYEYLAGRLASNGYIVVSISANKLNFADRHIAGDEGMLLARGQLVLRHLALLSDWNRNGTPANIQKTIGADLKGKLDFSNIAMMGHSRGDEGVRAARKLYPDAPWKKLIGDAIFKGIFEIAPTDGCRTFPFICKAGVDDRFKDGIIADGVPWNVLLPMCDGDLVELEGVRAFDRVLNSSTEDPASQKSSYTVWGANHNFYNTQWQISDATSQTAPFKAICIPDTVHIPLFPVSPGSPEQRLTALSSVLAFFRANVGKVDASFNQNFDPLYALPCKVTGDVDNKPANYPARVSRGYTPSPGKDVTTVYADFKDLNADKCGKDNLVSPDVTAKTTLVRQDCEDPNDATVTIPCNHDKDQKACAVTWAVKKNSLFLQVTGPALDFTARRSTFG